MMGYHRGDIIIGIREKVNHPIIYWSEHEDQSFFVGLALTHRRNGNLILSEEHFCKKPEGERDSFFVRRLLIKPTEWGPFIKIGNLSQLGIDYIENNLIEQTPVFWRQAIEEYRA